MPIVIRGIMRNEIETNTNMRWIFRPTNDQIARAQEIMQTDRYRNFSELLRQAMTIGFDQIQKDILVNGFEKVVRKDDSEERRNKQE